MNTNVKEYKDFKSGRVAMPSHLQPKTIEEGRLFKSKFMERVTRTPLWVPLLMFFCTIVSFIYYNITYRVFSNKISVLMFIIGLLSWSLIEYIVHRFLYHTETNSKNLLSVQHNAHGIHHQHPRDKDRLAMPPLPGIVLASLLFALFYGIMQSYAIVFFPGFLTGYIIYISMHYAQHRIRKPIYRPWQKLWKHHAYHHYINPYGAFGVSTRLWDFIFRTMPSKEYR